VLENSNVDLAKQLVDTIVAQRAYQANSTSISTQDELLQTIINL
jgi:flagellar hook protein FlgE